MSSILRFIGLAIGGLFAIIICFVHLVIEVFGDIVMIFSAKYGRLIHEYNNKWYRAVYEWFN